MAKFINKALMEEASKYDTLSHDSAETPFLFSTPFVFGRALVVRGPFCQGGLVAVEDESSLDPLSIVLADGREWEKAEGGEKVLDEGRRRKVAITMVDVGLTQEVGDFGDQLGEV